MSSHQTHPYHYHQISNTYHHCLTTFKAHSTSYVSSLTVAGKFLFTGSSDKEIRSWPHINNPSFNSVSDNNTVSAGKGAVKSLVISIEKLLLFSAHQDHKIRVWKINTNDDQETKYTHLATLPTLTDRTSKLLIPKNYVQIRRHKKSTWVHHVDTVSALALSNDESLLYSVSWDRTLKVWRTTDFKCLESVTNAHADAINAMVLDKHGKVYTGSADKKIRVWRKKPEEKKNKHCLVTELVEHSSGINALALSNDGSVLFSGACDNSIMVWEVNDGENGKYDVVRVLRGHTKAVLCLAVVSDLVCSGSADKSIRVWRGFERNNYMCLRVLEGHNGPIKCLSAVVDRCDNFESNEVEGFLVYSGSLDCNVKAWQIFVPLLL